MDPDEYALRQAILALPADDAPRLAYADWLLANGREWWGQFIIDQINHPTLAWHCRCVRQSRQTDVMEYYCNMCRELKLLSYDLRAAREWGCSAFRPRRGLLAELHLTLDEWRRYGAALVADWPLERVHLVDCEPRGMVHPSVRQPEDRRCFWFVSALEIELDTEELDVEAAQGGLGPTRQTRANLPAWLYCRLPQQQRQVGKRLPDTMTFADATAAKDALSVAALKAARAALRRAKKRGLPQRLELDA